MAIATGGGAATPSPLPDSSRPVTILRAERDRFVAFAFCWADAVLETDPDGVIFYSAGIFEVLIGRPATAVLGENIRTLIAPIDKPRVEPLLLAARICGRLEATTIRLATPDDGYVVVSLAGYQLRDLNDHLFLALRRFNPAELPTDAVSGASGGTDNEAGSGLDATATFVQMLDSHLAAGGDNEQRLMSLFVLRGFEDFTAQLSEATEQDLVADVTASLRGGALADADVGSLGPGRYALVHSDGVNVGGIRDAIAATACRHDPNHIGIPIESTSLALDAIGNDRRATAAGLVYAMLAANVDAIEGDSALTRAPPPSLSLLTDKAMAAMQALETIISGKQFEIAFQPIRDSGSGLIHHYEALVRFDSGITSLSPFELITLAEETGIIVDFDLAMVEKLIAWLRAEPAALNAIVAVNVSGKSITSPRYLDRLSEILRQNSWLRGRLMFEITESCRMHDLQSANRCVQELRRRGYPICLDDFGAGAANFHYLSSLEVDIVKLDGGSLRNAQKAHKGRAFLKALVGLCRDLDIATVAEMVEDEAALDFVRDCGVQYVQGYLFGRPNNDIAAFAAVPAGYYFH